MTRFAFPSSQRPTRGAFPRTLKIGNLDGARKGIQVRSTFNPDQPPDPGRFVRPACGNGLQRAEDFVKEVLTIATVRFDIAIREDGSNKKSPGTSIQRLHRDRWLR